MPHFKTDQGIKNLTRQEADAMRSKDPDHATRDLRNASYGSGGGPGTVSVIDTASNNVTATIGVGSHPSKVAVSPDGTKAYVTNAESNTVSVISIG